MDDLPHDVLVHTLLFIGKGHHRYISTISTKLHAAYAIVNEPHHRNVTTMKSVVSSPSCVEMYLIDSEGEDGSDAKLHSVLKAAARYGRINILEWAFKSKYSYYAWYYEDTFISAVVHGQLEALKWLHEHGCSLDDGCEYGYGCEYVKGACSGAAHGGHLEILQWLRANDFPWNSRTCEEAAKGGFLEVLKWARINNCPWHAGTCEAAASGGNLEILQWLRENNCPWNAWTCEEAAKGGYLEVLKWARTNGCSWNAWTCFAAACGGQLEVIKWARTNGCPWRTETCFAAARGGHLEVLEWAIENGCPHDELTLKYAAKEAVKMGNISYLNWLKEQGCHFDKEIYRCAADGGHVEVLEWLRANERRVDNNACVNWMRNMCARLF